MNLNGSMVQWFVVVVVVVVVVVGVGRGFCRGPDVNAFLETPSQSKNMCMIHDESLPWYLQ